MCDEHIYFDGDGVEDMLYGAIRDVIGWCAPHSHERAVAAFGDARALFRAAREVAPRLWIAVAVRAERLTWSDLGPLLGCEGTPEGCDEPWAGDARAEAALAELNASAAAWGTLYYVEGATVSAKSLVRAFLERGEVRR
jgi:hypothetical protein